MLQVISSPQQNSLFDALFTRIKENLDEGKSVVLVVPAQATLSMERKAFDALESEGFFNLHIIRGQKLHEIILNETSRPAETPINTLGRAMLLRKLASDYKNELKSFSAESLFVAITTLLGEKNINEYIIGGYVADIIDISDYVSANKDLLKPEVHAELFNPNRLILTKTQDEAPTLYRNGSSVKNSLVAAGCVIEGKIENCILFRNVRVEKDTVLQNCIIMQHATIRNNANLSNVILDKYAYVGKGVRLEGGTERPVIIPKNNMV
jgi:NDP-sugar pyrophosphorylase family protein